MPVIRLLTSQDNVVINININKITNGIFNEALGDAPVLVVTIKHV